MNRDLHRFLKDGKIEFLLNEDLSKKSHIGIGGRADLIIPRNEVEFVKILEYMHLIGEHCKVVGALSNTLICDNTYTTAVIKTSNITSYSVAEHSVFCGCGVKLSSLSRDLCRLGIEFYPELSGIPGTVGGMIRSNAGAYGRTVSDLFIHADFYDISEGCRVRLCKKQMKFSYRDSIMKTNDNLILLSATFDITGLLKSDIERKINKIAFLRRDTQPLEKKSLGSAFKRPIGYTASRLIDMAGLKGIRIGDAAVSHKHAGFIVNLGNATAKNVVDLIDLIKKRVYIKFGVKLEEEIEIWRD